MSSSLLTRSLSLLRHVRLPSISPALRGGHIALASSRQFASKTESSEADAAAAAAAEAASSAGRFFPRRCIMYVPGDDQKKLEKSLTISPDTFVFDCEDGVAANRKDEARNSITTFMQKLERDKKEYGVRINSVESGLAEEDLRTVLSGEKIPHSIFLPKVDSVEHINWFAEKLGTYMQRKDKDLNLIIYAESAQSLLFLREICMRTQELSEYHLFNLMGIVFGSDDFCASIGATRSNDAKEVMVARQQIVITAKAFGIQAIDVVYIDYKDLDGLQRQCIEGAKLGFTGKQCIHPGQIDIIQSSFTPSAEKIEWATELIKLFEEHQTKGEGAFTFRGSMIDKPLLLQAQNLVNISNVLKASP